MRLNALRELEVEKCTVTVDQLAAIVQLFTNLEILILSRNRGIGDWFLANQEVRLNGLKRINMFFCSLTEEQYEAAMRVCPNAVIRR